MTLSHNQPDQPPMASLIDIGEYVMPDIQHPDESDGMCSIKTTPISGSEYGGDDQKEPLMPKESLPTTKASVSEAHAGTQSNLVPSNKVIIAERPFDARNSLELSFSYGDILHVIGRKNDQWYKAFNPAQPDVRGLVPVAYFRDVDFWDTKLWGTRLGEIVFVGSILSSFLFGVFGPFIPFGGLFFLDWRSSVEPTTPCTSSSSCANKVQIPLCGPTKPYQPYHLLPAYNQTAYGILDCNHNATHAELWLSFFDKSTAATLVHFHDRGGMPNEIDCRPWKRPMLRYTEASGLNEFTPEEWAIQYLFLKEDRSVADFVILPSLGIDTPGPISCHNDETSLRRRSHQYIVQMEVVRQQIARKRQLEIKELEDKKKKSETTRKPSGFF